MNRKSFGNTLVALAALAALTAGCVKKISGAPENTAERYIAAVQAGDYKTIFDLNAASARQLKHLRLLTGGDTEKSMSQAMERFRQNYVEAPSTFQTGVAWAEKGFFQAGAQCKVGAAFQPVKAGDDPVNADYEKGNSVFVPVDVTYPDSNTALDHNGKKVKTAHYDCGLKKIREGKNVSVYSHDEVWYFGGCMVNEGTLTYFQ